MGLGQGSGVRVVVLDDIVREIRIDELNILGQGSLLCQKFILLRKSFTTEDDRDIASSTALQISRPASFLSSSIPCLYRQTTPSDRR